MSPLVISLALFAATVAAGTIAGGLVFIGLGQALRMRIDQTRAFGSAFLAAFIAAMIYGVLLKVLDKTTTQELINPAFFIATAAALAASFVSVLKSFEVEPKHVPMLWLPFAAILAAAFYLSRTMGTEWREQHGFYRGYEGVASLNLLNPPDAMSTPEKAVNYYNAQYKKLHAANEDEGIGKLLTSVTHWDAQWFNDNWPYISENIGKSDPFGITKVVQDPKQHKIMALSSIARPIFGKIKDVKIDGAEAMVLMDSGELVRLHKEGPNWKVRDWLGMRPLVMRSIYDAKERDNALTAEDKAAKDSNFSQYEDDTRALAAQVRLPYTPFNPDLDMDEKDGQKSTGYARLDAAKPNELLDVTQDQKQTPVPTPLSKEEQTRQKLALLNHNLDAQAAIQNGQPTPAPTATAAPTPASVVPTFIQGIDVSGLWPDYFQAIAEIERGDTNGIRGFLKCVTNDDAAWFQRNYAIITDLVTPGAQYTPEQSQLVALQAMARSMPHISSVKPTVKTGAGTGIAKFVEPPGGATNTYETMLSQEGGRWVMAHPFFARTFIWVPQIAAYKQAHGMPLAADEQAALTTGVGPIQQYVAKVYQQLGVTP